MSPHRGGVEDHEVGHLSIANQPAIADADLRGRGAGHARIASCQRHQLLLPHILAQHAWERAERSRVRRALRKQTLRLRNADESVPIVTTR